MKILLLSLLLAGNLYAPVVEPEAVVVPKRELNRGQFKRERSNKYHK